MKKISLLLIVVILISSLTALSSCEKSIKAPIINGVSLNEFTVVYDEQGLDYNKRAAEYIKQKTLERYGFELEVVDDSAEPKPHEIVVGETSRDISASLNAETEGLEFAILAKDGSVALEGDYFIIAAAAYFFMETYAFESAQESTVPETASIHEPITKEAKNFILLIGDGMGVYQTRLLDYMENTVEYGDGEDIFYGHLLPYKGKSRTDSLSGTTDSAAGGTALACGIKTYNEYIGKDKDLNDVKSLTELADELQMAAAVMSTEFDTGATPSSFAAHASDRDSKGDLMDSLINATQKYGTIIECGYDYYTESRVSIIKEKITETLSAVSENENGFFLMYEEAYIDKHCHNNDIDKAMLALVRFNQAIARFMEFAFYNPETFIIITADHETGDLYPDENGNLAYHHDDHTSADVFVFAYGMGAHVFDGVTVENIQIAHTIAAMMGDESFGDQSQYQSLTKAK